MASIPIEGRDLTLVSEMSLQKQEKSKKHLYYVPQHTHLQPLSVVKCALLKQMSITYI